MSVASLQTSINYDDLMQANLMQVFGERNAEQRLKAIRELYAENAVLYEPGSSASGHTAICKAVTELLASLPPDFGFSAVGPAVGHHNTGRLKWRSGLPNGPVAVTGTDVAHFEKGRIQSLYVFIDPVGAQ